MLYITLSMEKQNILVLDNTTSLVSPWKGELKKYFNVVEAVGGFEAVSKLKQQEFILVILNLSIRSFDGIDALIKIRKVKPQIPVIVIAEKSDIRFVRNAASYGINDYAFIPIEINEFLSKIEKVTNVNLLDIANKIRDDELAKEEAKKEKEKEKEKENELVDVPSLYYEGQSYLAREEVDKAIDIFNKILEVKRVKDTWRRFIEESYFQLGRCYIKKNEYKKAIDLFSQFIQKAPTSQYNKTAYFLIADCYENLNETSKAISIYKKLVNMPPFDSVSTRARKKLRKYNISI